MRKTGSQIITTLLERQGIDTVAGIPGGCNLPLYDALRDSSIRHVLARHEQGAGFIAQGMARATGKAAVCLGTSGPGATNLLTAIADGKLDSVPLVAITGQVPLSLIGTDAFQEVDTYGLTLPITKHNFFVRDTAELMEVIPAAFEIAQSGRPGPVAIDVPKDVQSGTVEFSSWPEPWRASPPPTCDRSDAAALAEMINASSRPVFYIGGGIIASEASGDLVAVAEKSSLPTACTLAGLGVLPAENPLFLGMLGMHGAPYTNLILDEADLLIAVGVRFDDRATGRAADFCRRADIAHIDIDSSEIDKIKESNLSICGDAGDLLRTILPMVKENPRSDWWKRIAAVKAAFPSPASADSLHPLNFMKLLSRMAGPDTIITTDVGQHQMWTAQAYPFRRPRTLLTSGGLGTMGFGLPAAIGAALAKPGSPVLCLSGDGSFLMNIQELATLAELDLDVKVLIMNNNHLGLVRQQQELFYGGRCYASKFDRGPDFPAVARGFGIRGCDLSGEQDPIGTLADLLATPGPAVVNVPVGQEENVFPIVPPGASNSEMIGSEVHCEHTCP